MFGCVCSPVPTPIAMQQRISGYASAPGGRIHGRPQNHDRNPFGSPQRSKYGGIESITRSSSFPDHCAKVYNDTHHNPCLSKYNLLYFDIVIYPCFTENINFISL